MFKIKINNQPANIEFGKFPAGENYFKCYTEFTLNDKVDITWKYESDEELAILILLLDYFKNAEGTLYIPYMPHARQDRQTTKEMPHSLNAIGKSIDHFNIKILDLHSFTWFREDNNISPTTIDAIVNPLKAINYDFIISPDKGAKNRSLEWACVLNKPLLLAEKTRDPLTGKLSHPKVPEINLEGKRVLIVDDICDGGYTFTQLAEVLKTQNNALYVDLYVTHGIFSKGLPIKYIDYVYTTNSYYKGGDSKHLMVIDVLNLY